MTRSRGLCSLFASLCLFGMAAWLVSLGHPWFAAAFFLAACWVSEWEEIVL